MSRTNDPNVYPYTEQEGWGKEEVGRIHFSYNTGLSGWACPKCGRVWAPWVMECLNCNNKQSKVGKNKVKDIQEEL